MSLLVIVIVAITGVLLARRIVRSLLEAVEVIKAVAGDDLTMHVATDSNDEFGKLMQAIDSMITSLRKIVGEVRTSVNTIATASNEIASGIWTCRPAPSNRPALLKKLLLPWKN